MDTCKWRNVMKWNDHNESFWDSLKFQMNEDRNMNTSKSKYLNYYYYSIYPSILYDYIDFNMYKHVSVWKWKEVSIQVYEPEK